MKKTTTKSNWIGEKCVIIIGTMVALVATAIPGTLLVAQAQDVAAKPDFRRLEIIIPYSAGGGTDTLCRRLVEDLRPKVDATIMVRNMPGDSAMTGLSRIQRAAPNEAILGFHNPPNTTFAQIDRGKKAPVDLRKLTPIAGYNSTCTVLATSKNSPYNTFKELAEAYASNKERLIAGTDRGGASELNCLLLRNKVNLQWKEYVAYDGSGDCNAAIARAEVPAGLASYESVLDGMKTGTLKPLLVLGFKNRRAGMPNTPTAFEVSGVSLAETAMQIRIIVGPPDMEPKMRDYFVKIWREILTDPVVIEKFRKSGVELEYMPPKEVDEYVKSGFDAIENMPELKLLKARK